MEPHQVTIRDHSSSACKHATRDRTSRFLPVLAAAVLAGVVSAQGFYVVVTETPPVSGTYQPVERYFVPGAGRVAIRLSDIPASMTHDPASALFRSPWELFIGNRAGHSGQGSVGIFYTDSYADFVMGPTFASNGLSDVAQMCFNPVDGELFAPNFNTGVLSRFMVSPAGVVQPNGTIQMPDGLYQLGSAIRPADQQLFVSSYDRIRRFARTSSGGYNFIGTFSIPGSSNGTHFMRFRGDELYIADVYLGGVWRYRFDVAGNPVANGSVPFQSPIDVAFSPDGREMFVTSHLQGGVGRFLYQSATDSWMYTETLPTPRLAGIAISPADPLGTWDIYGSSCVGSSGRTPTLAGTGAGKAGSLISIHVTSGPPWASAIMALGTGPDDVALPGGCTLLLSGILTDALLPLPLDADGNIVIAAVLPPLPTPLALFSQVFIPDTGSANGQYTLTNGLRLSVP